MHFMPWRDQIPIKIPKLVSLACPIKAEISFLLSLLFREMLSNWLWPEAFHRQPWHFTQLLAHLELFARKKEPR